MMGLDRPSLITSFLRTFSFPWHRTTLSRFVCLLGHLNGPRVMDHFPKAYIIGL